MSKKRKNIKNLEEYSTPIQEDLLTIVDFSEEQQGENKKIKLSTYSSSLQPNDASSIITGTLDNNRLSSNVTTLGRGVNSSNSPVLLTASSKYPAINGEKIENINIANVTNLSTNINLEENISNKVTVINDNSDISYPSEGAVKTYVDNVFANKEPNLPLYPTDGKFYIFGRVSGGQGWIENTKSFWGLGNVQNTDTTNPSNITSGTLNGGRISPETPRRIKNTLFLDDLYFYYRFNSAFGNYGSNFNKITLKGQSQIKKIIYFSVDTTNQRFISIDHGITNNDTCKYHAGGSASASVPSFTTITGMSNGVAYKVTVIDKDTFELYTIVPLGQTPVKIVPTTTGAYNQFLDFNYLSGTPMTLEGYTSFYLSYTTSSYTNPTVTENTVQFELEHNANGSSSLLPRPGDTFYIHTSVQGPNGIVSLTTGANVNLILSHEDKTIAVGASSTFTFPGNYPNGIQATNNGRRHRTYKVSCIEATSSLTTYVLHGNINNAAV